MIPIVKLLRQKHAFCRHSREIITSEAGALIKSPGYAYAQGTSMACPQVTGAVALLAAAGASSSEIPGILTSSATRLPAPGTTNRYSGF